MNRALVLQANSHHLFGFTAVGLEYGDVPVLEKIVELRIDGDRPVIFVRQIDELPDQARNNDPLIVIFNNDSIDRIDVLTDGVQNLVLNNV